MDKSKIVVACLGALVVGACTSTSPDMHPELGNYVSLPMASNFDENATSSETKTVVVLDSNRGFSKAANKVFSEATNYFLGDRGIVVAEENIANRMKDDILLATHNDKGVYEGPESADYTIIATVSSLSVETEYSKSERKQNKDGEYYTNPAKCKFEYTFRANLEIRTLPSLELLENVTFKETETDYQDNPASSRCPVTEEQKLSKANELASDGLRTSESAESLMTLLSPKFYVLEAYELDGKTYFKTTVGRKSGVAEGRKVNLYTAKPDGGLLLFGEGEFVSDKFADDKSSFIAVDKDLHARIQRGTVLKISADSCGTFDLKCHSQGTIFDM